MFISDALRKTLTFIILTLILILTSVPYPTISLTYPPTVKHYVITWSDDDGQWIMDVTVYSEMPWTPGSIASIHLRIKLRVGIPGKEIHLIAKVCSNGKELSSRYIGLISLYSKRIDTELKVYIPYANYGNNSIGKLIQSSVTITIKGFSDSKLFTESFDFPITIYTGTSVIRARILLNGKPYYNIVKESLTKINMDIELENIGDTTVMNIIVDVYIDNELVDTLFVESLNPKSRRNVTSTVFTYISRGLHNVKAIIRYELPDGTQVFTQAQALLEAYPNIKITFNTDKTAILEGTCILFYGKITPPINGIPVFLEKSINGKWIIVNITTTDRLGEFNFTWKAKEVPVYKEFEYYMFRVRVPVSRISERVSITSTAIPIIVYSKRRVVDLIIDIILHLEQYSVFTGSKVKFAVTIKPRLPLYIPVKIVYYDKTLFQWVMLDELYIFDGYGEKEIKIDLPPGKYPVKAVIVSEYGTIESLPRAINVIKTPSINIYVPSVIVYGKPIRVIVELKPRVSGVLKGQINLTSNGEVVYNKSIEVVDGVCSIRLPAIFTTGKYRLEVCVMVGGRTLCNRTEFTVVKPSLTITPKEQTVEIGAKVEYMVKLKPPLNTSLIVNLLSDSTVLETRKVTVSHGVARISFNAPGKTGKYILVALLENTNITNKAVLNVIKVIRSIQLSLLNETIYPEGKVYAKVRLTPPPTKPLQVQVLMNINGEWTPTAFSIVGRSGEEIITFNAPTTTGEYKIKAIVPEMNLESNIISLNVISPVKPLIPQKYLYGIISITVVASILLYLIGKRKG